MNKNEAKVDINKYDEIISNLTKELESLRNQLAVKIHSQYLLRSQDKANSQNSKIEKIAKEISAHFQEEIRMKKELLEIEKLIDNLNLNLKEKEFLLFKAINIKKGGNNLLKEKEYRSQINKITEQINLQKGILIAKETKYNETFKKRENFENLVNKFGKDKNGSSLPYLYHCFVFEINNLTNEHIRRQNLTLLRQKEMKIAKLIEQLKIRDEYINTERKELKNRNIHFVFADENQIKRLEELNIDRSFSLPTVIQQQEVPIQVKSPSRRMNTSADLSKQRTTATNLKYDYSAYNNPNIVKEKQQFKTKTNEIINKSKRNELSQLRLNILNDSYKNSKVVYVNKKNNREYDNDNYVITFDAKFLNKSQSNASLHSIPSHNDSGSGLNIKEREIDNKIRKIMVGKKKISPYINK